MKRPITWSLCTAPLLSLALVRSAASDEPRLVWGDFDGDGLADLATLEPGRPVRLLRNAGDGTLLDVTDASGVAEHAARDASWQDVDGDGLQDLLLVRADGRSALYRGLGGGRFEESTQRSGLDLAPACTRARWVDYDGDGHADLELWTERGVQLLHNDGLGLLRATEPAWIAAADAMAAPAAIVGDATSTSEADPVPAAPPERNARPGPGSDVAPPRIAVQVSGSSSARVGGGGLVAGTTTEYCPPGLQDDAFPGTCIAASSVPALNKLFPLTSDLFVDVDGDVGFGTTNPRSHVHLRGAAGEATLRLSTSTANGTSRVLLLENNNPDTNLVGGAVRYDGALDQMQLSTLGGGNEHARLVIERTTGEVGINTTSPRADLHVVGGPSQGSLIVAPNEPASGGDSQLVLAENVDGEFGMALSYDGTGNELQLRALNAGVGTTHVTLGRDSGRLSVGGSTGSGRLEVLGDLSGVGSASLRAVNTNAGNGNAAYAESAGTGTTAILKQLGSGAILKGETAAGTLFTVSNTGRVITTALQITGGGDLVEGFESDEALDPGTVVAIDPTRPGRLTATRAAYDTRVAGVVSGAGGVQHGIRMGQDGVLDGEHLVAMAGRVYVRCTDENGAIAPGDLLTSSSLPGQAMRASDSGRSFGAVIGKAMTALDGPSGLVLVLVNLQ